MCIKQKIYICLIGKIFFYIFLKLFGMMLEDLSRWKLQTSYTITQTSRLAAYLGIHRKGKFFKKLFNDLKATVPISNFNTNMAVCVILCMHFLYAFAYSLSARQEDHFNYFIFYTYGNNVADKTLRSTRVFLKVTLSSFLFPTFINIITLLFCKSCHHIAAYSSGI